MSITVIKDGPLQVRGDFDLLKHGGEDSYDLGGRRSVLLCRCGRSAKKPYCDGSHKRTGFTEADTGGPAPTSTATTEAGDSGDVQQRATGGADSSWTPPYQYWPIIDRPPIEWPDAARVAFWVALNIEYFEPDKPSTSLTRNTIGLNPDPLNIGWRDYGPRVGVWRLIDLFDKYEIRASVPLNSDACLHYPQVIRAGNERNWVWLAHGKTNSARWTNIALEDERRALGKVVDAIREHTGQSPRGWLGPGMGETHNTLALLVENGVTYVCDWCNDDQPYPLDMPYGRLISVPYSGEMNDFSLFLGKTTSGQDFYDIVTDQFDVLYEEGAQRPRVMVLALHPMITGQPYRLKHLGRVLEYIAGHDDVWLTTSDEIAALYHRRYYDEAVSTLRATRSMGADANGQ